MHLTKADMESLFIPYSLFFDLTMYGHCCSYCVRLLCPLDLGQKEFEKRNRENGGKKREIGHTI